MSFRRPLGVAYRAATARQGSRLTKTRAPVHRNFSSLISAETIYSPSPSFLEEHVANTSTSSTGGSGRDGVTDEIALFLLSTSIPSSSLSPLLSAIRARWPESIGSFSSSAPSAEPSLSIARFKRSDSLSLWYDPQVGRAPAEVGRWQRHQDGRVTTEDQKGDRIGELDVGVGVGLGGNGERDWDKIWQPERDVERIADLEGLQREQRPSTILMLTSATPRPTLQSLDHMFPQSVKAGLISTPTPFLTGRPNTLFIRDRIYDSGTVGLVIPELPEGQDINFALEPLSDMMEVDSAQGNMLLSLKGAPNPTQHLIQAIQARSGSSSSAGLTKEEDFYLALISPDGSKEVVRLVSGDPSRGALSLDTEDSLRVGQTVQFMQRSTTSKSASPSAKSLTFGALPRTDAEEDHPLGKTPRSVPGLLALSEGGFVHSRAGSRSVVCTAPFASLTLR